jgi:hypothetical protein
LTRACDGSILDRVPANDKRTVHVRLKLHRRRAITATIVAAFALALVPTAAASAHIYWWQQNMWPNNPAYDRMTAHNHTYNELYFGPNAGWRSEVWEVTPAGYRHFDKWCYGNCFFAHPGYYYDYSYCANRDGSVHFVNDCMDEW